MLLDSELVFAVWFLVITWLISITLLLYKTIRSIKRFQVGKKEVDIATVLEKISGDQERFSQESKAIEERLTDLEKKGTLHFQKVGLIRFNPFSETGGDQSFALALLDEHDSGFIISSLHSRENTRVYAKPVKKGEPLGYNFSREEKEAVDKACKPENKRI